jgi:hypothetical protein
LSSLRLMARQEGNSMTRFQLVIAGLTTEGSSETGFLAGYGDGGRLVGAISVGRSEETEALVETLIAERAPGDVLARDLIGGRS